jgi:SprT-like family
MARPNPIRRLMACELPSITYQRRKLFRPSYADITYAYNIINRHVFDNALTRPTITQGTLRKAWGLCNWETTEQVNGSWCSIKMSDKWFCQQWFLNTLAHEMVHQYQWDIYRWDHMEYYGKEMHVNSGGHGPSFYEWRDRFAHYGLTLKISYGQKRWFKHQSFDKC